MRSRSYNEKRIDSCRESSTRKSCSRASLSTLRPRVVANAKVVQVVRQIIPTSVPGKIYTAIDFPQVLIIWTLARIRSINSKRKIKLNSDGRKVTSSVALALIIKREEYLVRLACREMPRRMVTRLLLSTRSNQSIPTKE